MDPHPSARMRPKRPAGTNAEPVAVGVHERPTSSYALSAHTGTGAGRLKAQNLEIATLAEHTIGEHVHELPAPAAPSSGHWLFPQRTG